MGNSSLSHSALIMLCACHAGGPFEEEGTAPDERLAFNPDAAVYAETMAAVWLLRDATGLPFRIDPKGTPVRLVQKQELAYCEKGECDFGCGGTKWDFREGRVLGVTVRMRRAEPRNEGMDCLSMDRSIAHELIHVARRTPWDLRHAEAGLFRAESGDPILEESSLMMLCERVDCLKFEPER